MLPLGTNSNTFCQPQFKDTALFYNTPSILFLIAQI